MKKRRATGSRRSSVAQQKSRLEGRPRRGRQRTSVGKPRLARPSQPQEDEAEARDHAAPQHPQRRAATWESADRPAEASAAATQREAALAAALGEACALGVEGEGPSEPHAGSCWTMRRQIQQRYPMRQCLPSAFFTPVRVLQTEQWSVPAATAGKRYPMRLGIRRRGALLSEQASPRSRDLAGHNNLTFPSQLILFFLFIYPALSLVLELTSTPSTSCQSQQPRRCATFTQKTRFLSRPSDGRSSWLGSRRSMVGRPSLLRAVQGE